MLTFSTTIDPRIALGRTGLLLGAETRLAKFAGRADALAIDPARLQALFAVAFKRAPSSREINAIEASARHWQRGDKALANLRLVFANLPKLDEPEDAVRLKAAELLFDADLRADDLPAVIDESSVDGIDKYDRNQPRVPAGSGDTSGQWASLWSRFSSWLDQQVPVYDQDTGIQYGTQSRARAILTSPLTVGIAGAGALLGGEALLPAAAVAPEAAAVAAPVAEETEALSPFAQRYLSASGGRLGSTTTRRQLYEIARPYVRSDKFVKFRGDGEGPEEFIPGPGPGTKGSTFVDFSAETASGSTVRVQTVNTLADGVTPTKYELDAAARIRAAARPGDALRLIPKRKP